MLQLAENLRKQRRQNDMTQEEVAEMLSVSPQSVSKWERGETLPDITMLPALSHLFQVSVDALLGMDSLQRAQAQNALHGTVHDAMRAGDYAAAADALADALRSFPNDEGFLSELAMTLALEGGPERLDRAVAMCEGILSGRINEKVRHTARAALSLIHMKAGDSGKAIGVASHLPHTRESREVILAELKKNPSQDDIDAYLRFIALGEEDAQSAIAIEFGLELAATFHASHLREQIEALRKEVSSRRLPTVHIRDLASLAPRQLTVRRYADVLLDATYADVAAVEADIMEALRNAVLRSATRT